MKQYVTIAGPRRVTLASYVFAWRTCIDLVRDGRGDMQIKHTPCSEFGGSAAEALRQFRDGLTDRINKRGVAL